jgi:hypothetical protein
VQPGLVNLLQSSPGQAAAASAGGGSASNVPSTSGSGVPNYSANTQEFNPSTPNPVVPPVASVTPPGAVTSGNASPFSAVSPSTDPGVYSNPAYIQGINQNVDAFQSNEGLAPTFTQAGFNAAYTAAFGPGGGGVPQFNAALGLQDQIAPTQVAIDQETAAFGSVANYNAAVDAGATVTGEAANGQWEINWGNYTGPGSPGYQAPGATPPTAPPASRPAPTFSPGSSGIPNPGNNRALPPPPAPPAPSQNPLANRTITVSPGGVPSSSGGPGARGLAVTNRRIPAPGINSPLASQLVM